LAFIPTLLWLVVFESVGYYRFDADFLLQDFVEVLGLIRLLDGLESLNIFRILRLVHALIALITYYIGLVLLHRRAYHPREMKEICFLLCVLL